MLRQSLPWDRGPPPCCWRTWRKTCAFSRRTHDVVDDCFARSSPPFLHSVCTPGTLEARNLLPLHGCSPPASLVWSPCGSSHIGPRLYLGIAGRPGPQARRAVSGPTAGRGLQFALSLSLSLSPQRPADLLGRLLPINRPPGSPNPYPARARTVDRPRSIERQSGVVNRGGASEFGDGGRARQINRRGGSTAGVAGRPYLNVIILKIIAHFSLTPRPPPPPSMHRRRPLGHSGPRERQQQGAGGGDRVLWADRGMETLGGR